MVRLLTEKEENEIAFEDFPFVYNPAVSFRKLFEKIKTITIFLKEEKMKNTRVLIVFVCMMAAVNFTSAEPYKELTLIL